MNEPMKYLGDINRWRETPPEIVAHNEAIKAGQVHDVEERKIGRCITVWRCRTCGIEWECDTSD